MKLAEIKQAVAEALEVEPNALNLDTVLEELPGFDSIKLLALMVALDDIGIQVNESEVSRLKTYNDILALARQRVGDLS